MCRIQSWEQNHVVSCVKEGFSVEPWQVAKLNIAKENQFLRPSCSLGTGVLAEIMEKEII